MTIGEKLAKLRKENNMTQEQFADCLHVSRQSVSKWEQNLAYPETEKLVRIGKLFACSLDYLLKDEIESMDINRAAALDEAQYNHAKAAVLTFLSFPPVVGLIAGVLSLIHQKKKVRNRTQTIITIIGMIFSLSMTVLMAVGIIFGL